MQKSETRVQPESTFDSNESGLTIDRLRLIVQDSHLNFLIGAGTSTPYFQQLGDIENVLTELAHSESRPAANLVRASLQAYFFDRVLMPNLAMLNNHPDSMGLLTSYSRLVSFINRVLLRRRNTLIGKQANIFTTNVDLAFEIVLESLEIATNDGFSGKFHPRFDLGEFGTLRMRQGPRYEYRSEVPVVNLFKIHGSAGWQQSGDEIYFDHQLSQILQVSELVEEARQGLLRISCPSEVNTALLLKMADGLRIDSNGEKFVTAYNQLSIVNPEKTKFATTVLNKTYYELIRKLANELEKENSVLFVHGFSFRDEHLRDLVLRAARTNPTLQVYVFCYSREGYGSMRRLLPDEQIKNGNISLIQPAPPNDGKERKITLDVFIQDYFSHLVDEAPRSVIQKDHNSIGVNNDS